MYAIICNGGKQHRVTEGERVRVEYLVGDVGDKVSLGNILLVGNQDSVEVGTPFLTEARITGTIVEQGKEKKVTIFKFKRRKMYRRKLGHRQLFTELEIGKILVGKDSRSAKKDQADKPTVRSKKTSSASQTSSRSRPKKETVGA